MSQAPAPTTPLKAWLGRTPPEAYLDPVDRQIAATGEPTKERPFPCAYWSTENGRRVIKSLPTERCVQMTKPQRWTGIWVSEFENSSFCPVPARKCEWQARERSWLDVGKVGEELRDKMSGRVHRIEFIGRRTKYPGMFGHMGMAESETVVDRLISITPISSER